jgi:hypothetical protein
LPLLHFYFTFSRIERVSHELIFHSNNQKREGSDLHVSCQFYLNSMEKFTLDSTFYVLLVFPFVGSSDLSDFGFLTSQL